MKIKYNGFKYLAYADYNEGEERWLPFWNQNDAAALFGKLDIDKETDIDDKIAYFQNCGTFYTKLMSNGSGESYQTACSAAWPNPNCNHCGGLGLGATINLRF